MELKHGDFTRLSTAAVQFLTLCSLEVRHDDRASLGEDTLGFDRRAKEEVPVNITSTTFSSHTDSRLLRESYVVWMYLRVCHSCQSPFPMLGGV